jgi:hypothetical protein
VVSKARAAVQKAVSDLTGALANLKINGDAATAAASTAAGVAAATPAGTITTTSMTATTARGAGGAGGAGGAEGAGGGTGLSSLFSSDFLNKFSDTIMTNSNANVTIDFEYQGDKGKWFDYLSQQHKDAVATQQSAIAAAAAATSQQNKLLSNMGKATGSQVYYDDNEDCSEDSTPATQQGCELTSVKKGMKCPTIDTNQYVRKDSVPCWGCDLE